MTASESAPSASGGACAIPRTSDGSIAYRADKRLPSIILGTMSLEEGKSLARIDAMTEVTEIEDIVRRSAIAESPYFRLPDGVPTVPLPAVDDGSHLLYRGSHSGHTENDGLGITIALPAMGTPRLVPDTDDRISCGSLRRALSDTEGHTRGVAYRCKSLSCPICYPARVNEIVDDRIMPRIMAEISWRMDAGLPSTVYHIVLSAPPNTPLRTLGEWNTYREDANRRIKLILGDDAGAVAVTHDFRERDAGDPRGAVIDGHPVWDHGPHFHYMVIGRIDVRSSTLKRVREGGWVFKVVPPDDPKKNPAVKHLKPTQYVIPHRSIRARVHYLVSHASIVTPDGGKTRDSYTFLGTMNPRSKRGLRSVADCSEIVYPVVEGDGDDTARRFLFDQEELELARKSVHGSRPCVAYSVTRRYKVFTHLTREELDDAIMERYRAILARYTGGRAGPGPLDAYVEGLNDRKAVPGCGGIGRGSVETLVGKLTLDDWRAIPGVYVEIVKGANGPTEKEWFERSGTRRPPELGDRWDAPGEPMAPLSATDRALDAWRTVYRGLTFEEVDAIVNGGDGMPSDSPATASRGPVEARWGRGRVRVRPWGRVRSPCPSYTVVRSF